MKVTKRNGTSENYSIQTVKRAIREAFKTSKHPYTKDTIQSIVDDFVLEDKIHVEEIQNQIEQSLQKHGFYDVAKEFILYRDHKNEIRNWVQSKKKFIERYKSSSNTANATVDDNSNVSSKNIGVMNAEIHKEDNIQVNRGLVMDKIKQLYPDFNPKSYVKDIKSHVIYKNDESSFSGISPYCVSVTMYPFLLEGLSKIGGLSARPKNLDSYCGMFVNFIFAVSAQFAGACLYKDQDLIFNHNNINYNYKIKDFVSQFNLTNTFSNYQGTWEYADISNLNYLVNEDGKFVKVKKVYRRKYNKNIYKITSSDNHIAYVSEDHIFKTLYGNRILEVKAKNLVINDTVFMSKDNSYISNNINSSDFKEGFITGCLCGDGCITRENEIRLAVNYNQKFIIDIFNEYLNDLYGITLSSCTDGNGCYDFRKYTTEYYSKIIKHITGKTTYDKHIENITNKSLDFIIGFLDGIGITDGSYSKGHGILVTCCNELLIKNIDDALNMLQIPHSSYKTNTDVVGNRSISYTIYMPKPIVSYLKYTQLKPTNTYNDTAPQTSFTYKYCFGSHALYIEPFKKRPNKNYWSSTNRPIQYNTDIITNIETFVNDDEYVYEIETETHWYNCNGFITHNCATPEALVFFDYFAKKEFGDDYYLHYDEFYKIGPDLRKLFNISGKWFKNVNELREYDFNSPDLNTLRDKIVYNSERELTTDELREWEQNNAANEYNPINLGDCTRTIGSSIHQYFQQIVYSINQPAASRGMQSSFVNFGYFDKPFFEGMFGEFVFPDLSKPTWDSVSWLQKDFMMWFNKERLKTVITFPVESMALVYKDGKFLDEETAKFTAEEYARGHSFFTYMSDTVDSLSSCCFEGNTPVLYVKPEDFDTDKFTVENIESVYNKYHDKTVKVYQETITDNLGLKCKGEWKDAELVKAEALQEIQIYLEPMGIGDDEHENVMRVTPDHIFPVLTKDGIQDKHAYLIETGDKLCFERQQSLFTLETVDVNETDMQDMIFRSVIKVYKAELDVPKPYYCFKIADENIQPYFLLPNGCITHNCRLKNKIQTKEFNFTNGNLGVQTGSKSVISLNLNRITQDWYNNVAIKAGITKDTFFENIDSLLSYLGEILERVYKYHTAYNELLWDLYDAGLLPVYKAGFISLDKQYLTIGLNGLNAMSDFLNIPCTPNDKYSLLCQKVFGYIKEQNQLHAGKFNNHKLTFNTEMVPKRSGHVKLLLIDLKLLINLGQQGASKNNIFCAA